MKKFVVLEGVGTWSVENGKTVIDCTVKRLNVVFESNDWKEVCAEYERRGGYHTRYDNDGYWYDYRTEFRAAAKRELNGFKNKI